MQFEENLKISKFPSICNWLQYWQLHALWEQVLKISYK